MLESVKVVAEESLEVRTDVPASLGLSSTDIKEMPEAKLSEVKPEDVKRMAGMQSRETPLEQIQGIGQRGLAMGFAILGVSFLFPLRPNAQDPEKDFRLRYLLFDKPPRQHHET